MKSIYYLLVLGLFALSCQDTKKATPKATQIEQDIAKDSITPVSKQKTTVKAHELPFLNEDNVEGLLLEYGKNNLETKAKISTTHGDIFLELYKDTPLHRANFVYLVKEGYFNNTFFHRVVPNFIIQAGSSDNASTNKKRANLGKYRLPAELDNGRIHQRGTISGAKNYRENPDNKSAAYEFFIFLGPLKSTSHLNNKYTIFGRVTKGMDVVDTIANLPADEGEWPLTNVYISVELLD